MLFESFCDPLNWGFANFEFFSDSPISEDFCLSIGINKLDITVRL
jgi:hypothetical protein